MVIGKRKKPKQQPLWIAHSDLVSNCGHPFYTRLNRLLDDDGFDTWIEGECTPYFATCCRSSIPPGVYFRMLFIGYLEVFSPNAPSPGTAGTGCRYGNSSVISCTKCPPDHSTFTVWRQRLPLELYSTVFQRILCFVALIDAYAAGVDSTTLEANASLRRLTRKDTGASYREYVKELMREAGEDPDDPDAFIRFDKKRKGKTLSNQDWQSESDPDARIAKMKDGTLHLAYKSEHEVDLHTGAMLGVAIYPADQGDTACIADTLTVAEENLATLGETLPELLCVVTDKGYHQAELIKDINADKGITTSIPERLPTKRRRSRGDHRPARNFTPIGAVPAAKKANAWASRLRAEVIERSFALFKRSGNLGRMPLRGQENVTKRSLIHAAAHNLGLILRTIFGHGTPKGMADAFGQLIVVFLRLVIAILKPKSSHVGSRCQNFTGLPRLTLHAVSW